MPEKIDHMRVSFEEADIERLSETRIAVHVVLAWDPADRFVGGCEGVDSDLGQLECAATATLRALERALDHKVSLHLVGLEKVGSLNCIITNVVCSHDVASDIRLAGAAFLDGRPVHCSVRAVLQATNRLVTRTRYQSVHEPPISTGPFTNTENQKQRV